MISGVYQIFSASFRGGGYLKVSRAFQGGFRGLEESSRESRGCFRDVSGSTRDF